ncbi:MAG: dihydrolipoyl dehydrogenase, partial [Solirubrobacteraceae bacterium]|nr:dihydrolipoyl dehydrogenase [Solirubrobacteraceae bacterium]
MADHTFDLVIVGSGPGGYVSAIRAAQLGLKTAVIEKADIGGRCLNVACIPAKAVLRSADVLSEVREANEFGIGVSDPTVDWNAISERRKKIISTLTGGVSGLLKKNNVEVFDGVGSLNADATVTVEGVGTIEATKAVLLATGSVPRAIPGIDYGARVIGTEEAWALPELPGSLAVVGAGASGSEIASAYARLGSTVTLLEGLDRVLPGEDADISRVAARGFKKQGIEVLTKTFAENVKEDGDKVTFTAGGQERSVDYLVVATGRRPDVDALGIDKAGIELTEQGLIKVSELLQTSNPKVYAIGDLVPGPALAHKSMEEGIVAIETIAGNKVHGIDHPFIPRATFCEPNVASFGYTEAQAKELGYDVKVGKVPYGAVGAPLVYGATGTVKVISDGKYGEILGGHVVGAKATELIQELVNARELEGGIQEVAR